MSNSPCSHSHHIWHTPGRHTLDELVIELFYPADDTTEQLLRDNTTQMNKTISPRRTASTYRLQRVEVAGLADPFALATLDCGIA